MSDSTLPHSQQASLVEVLTFDVRHARLLLSSAELSTIHVCNAKLLACREELYERLPRGGVGAELGVAAGDNARSILARAQPRILHLMDIWRDERAEDYRGVQREFGEYISEGRVVLHQGDDLLSLMDLPDSYLDWVYLDTSHQYDHTQKELELLARKLKPTGILCGHDYVNYDVWLQHRGERAWYRLKQCVNEFCIENGWEFIYLTMECAMNPSFAIRKMGV
jgi:SAM-dependent methyltransferase